MGEKKCLISLAVYVTVEKGRWHYNGKFISMHLSCCLTITTACRVPEGHFFRVCESMYMYRPFVE